MSLTPKKPAESQVEMADIILPAQTNALGTIFGGEVMSYVDRIASIAASRHSGQSVVTASFDSLDFLSPIRLGEVILLRAVVTWTGRTSMEIMVTIEAENSRTGERRVTGVSFLTFVAVDHAGRPVEVPPLEPETDAEKYQFELAKDRAAHRKQRREKFVY
ncbi:acyl-CoA thioesterase [Effusibacillus dendaii]|uniref:Putative acyl-CoA thioester hydrolase YkhA n=1 Tax=Effusibacillus dendaii TaxID=2743772 RepID=A0A7I8DAJ6_9BACL|nr:acyl-CoA thioesterase [Effusibacillus dendaii]BCJ87208.1 putative acyl-CoA thioester hydrolase YkhA [Effusibacillus dendaii]